MKYLSGFYALTIACKLNTDGSTHFGSLDWSTESLDMKDSENSIFGDWGIEKDKVIFACGRWCIHRRGGSTGSFESGRR